MHRRPVPLLAAALALLAAGVAGAEPPPPAPAPAGEDPAAQVRAAETAFAASMAARDHAAFTSFLADETIFVGRSVLRGKAAVAEGWKRFFAGEAAPFSWRPETVEVVDSGTLALSTGPVFDPQGQRIGTFNSTWRREPDGRWRIVLDNGCPPCDCGGAAGGGTP
jgi:ketosteroid isomerase-like protein